MGNDALWQTIRNGLTAAGTLMAAAGWFDIAKVEPAVNIIMATSGIGLALGTVIWTVRTSFGTKAVPIEIADRPDVPTVNPITGSSEPATQILPPLRQNTFR